MKYIILIITGLFVGCSTNKSTSEGEFHLLYEEETLVYKSITIKDYTIEESC